MLPQKVDVRQDRIPLELQNLPLWVTWRAEPRDDGGFSKIPWFGNSPYDFNKQEHTLPRALKLLHKCEDLTGIGLRIAEPYLCIDLDNVVAQGEASPIARLIVDHFQSYTEISPSGRGLAIIIHCPSFYEERNTDQTKYILRGLVEGELYFGHWHTITSNVYLDKPIATVDLETLAFMDQYITKDTHPYLTTGARTTSQPLQTSDHPEPRLLDNEWLTGLRNAYLQDLITQEAPDRSQRDFKLASLLFKDGYDEATIAGVLCHPEWDSGYKQRTRKDPERKYTWDTIRRIKQEYAKNQPKQKKKQEPKHALKPTLDDAIVAFLEDLDLFPIRYNELKHQVFVKDQELDKFIHARIMRRARLADLDYGAAINDIILDIAGNNRYNPFKEFLEGLQWDGQDYFQKLKDVYPEDMKEKDISFKFIWKFLLGAIDKVYTGYDNPMLILKGPQGAGKGTFCEWLANTLDSDYYCEKAVDVHKDDHRFLRAKVFIWQVAELDSTTGKSIAALKSFLTEKRTYIRRPYERTEINPPNICSFIGTVNETGSGFLHDITGNRRFTVITAPVIDRDVLLKLDSAALWAQVMAAYTQGERGYYTADERVVQETRNNENMSQNALVDYIVALFEPDTREGSYLSNVVIQSKLMSIGAIRNIDQATTNRIARALTELKYEKGTFGPRDKRVRGVANIKLRADTEGLTLF